MALNKGGTQRGQARAAMQESERTQKLDDIDGVRGRKTRGVWVSSEEAVVHRLDKVGASALEEKLGDEYGVRIVRISPRKVPTVLPKPP